jgi:mannose-6-phosphate isomerase-like protein (cupin superfamily)
MSAVPGLAAIALPAGVDTLAPDGSQIRLLAAASRGSMCHCTLLPGQVSVAVRHRTVEELWYFISGAGEVWRRLGEAEAVTLVAAGVSLAIPCGCHFQFRNTGAEPLCFVLVTMPPWPGAEEAVAVPGHWPARR